MSMLYYILQKETADKVIKDAKQLKINNNIRNKYEFGEIMDKNISYWRSEAVGYNPIQESIIIDSLWRIVNNLPQYSGLYDN